MKENSSSKRREELGTPDDSEYKMKEKMENVEATNTLGRGSYDISKYKNLEKLIFARETS